MGRMTHHYGLYNSLLWVIQLIIVGSKNYTLKKQNSCFLSGKSKAQLTSLRIVNRALAHEKSVCITVCACFAYSVLIVKDAEYLFYRKSFNFILYRGIFIKVLKCFHLICMNIDML